MPVEEPLGVGYVVKRYPRYSETFIVTEILAHEEAGLPLKIFSLYPPVDTHFQDAIARVRAPVNYVPDSDGKSLRFWEGLCGVAADVPGLWNSLDAAKGEEARDVFQAAVVAGLARRKGIRHLHAHFGSGAATVARLKHPNTITVFDYGSADLDHQRIFFIAMELLEGMPLSKLVSQGRFLTPTRAVHIALQICRALREAHRAGTKVMSLVGNVRQARRLEQMGVDVIIAQGAEEFKDHGKVCKKESKERKT